MGNAREGIPHRPVWISEGSLSLEKETEKEEKRCTYVRTCAYVHAFTSRGSGAPIFEIYSARLSELSLDIALNLPYPDGG